MLEIPYRNILYETSSREDELLRELAKSHRYDCDFTHSLMPENVQPSRNAAHEIVMKAANEGISNMHCGTEGLEMLLFILVREKGDALKENRTEYLNEYTMLIERITAYLLIESTNQS